MATNGIVITVREHFLLALAAAIPAALVSLGPWFAGALLQGVVFFIIYVVLMLLGVAITARMKRRHLSATPHEPSD